MVLGPRPRLFLPYLNFVIATAALGFQTTVLYPWHHTLDDEFKKLKLEQSRMLKELHDAKLQKFSEVEARVITIEQKLREGMLGKAR
ncbi:hypothetical protein BDY19DRAFT_973488 [Irpex rosettiformis]|uniref:Uncharacterized protein n=1 Tax=Irpex rosettiformis TaxID=378272 RepID=A0ACB8TQ34_9APHY|nr:hypothetical protein BDY19DRAFT_973488 [Irpex rosettiformis]